MKNSVKAGFFILFIMNFALHAEISSVEDTEKNIQNITQKINKNNVEASLYISRGNLYFSVHDFDSAVEDFSTAIEIDKTLDEAWFGRGMANARMGFISEGISDLTVYLQRNPNDSNALTKRGVRYLWKGDKKNAQDDLQRAIKIDPNNAEAHDDLGVVLSQLGNYKSAIDHFNTTIQIDPSYQKAHHNLAMALYITENDLMALASVNNSLALKPDSRGSLLLKSKILTALGRHTEAKNIEDEAIFLPEANWSESAPIK